MNSLDKLKSTGTEIVADTGDIFQIKQIKPIDVTTNPSLILKSLNDKNYSSLFNTKDLEVLLVNFGSMILEYVKGYVSIEVNPIYSYNTEKTIEIARKIINIFEDRNINRERILIKIATTWEGIMAAKVLEKENIQCNMTLIFSKIQAIACSQNNITLISPFVGRITDWYKNNGYTFEKTCDDMGIISIKDIFYYLKSVKSKTIVMGASFRNINQIKELSGIDKLTISPKLISELQNDKDLNFTTNIKDNIDPELSELEEITKEDFENDLNNNKMFKENLENGIKKFIDDTESIIKFLEK